MTDVEREGTYYVVGEWDGSEILNRSFVIVRWLTWRCMCMYAVARWLCKRGNPPPYKHARGQPEPISSWYLLSVYQQFSKCYCAWEMTGFPGHSLLRALKSTPHQPLFIVSYQSALLHTFSKWTEWVVGALTVRETQARGDVVFCCSTTSSQEGNEEEQERDTRHV